MDIDNRGIKHLCSNCGTKFYDLNKQEIFTHYHSGGKGFIPQFHPNYFKHLKNDKNFKPL